MPASKVSPEIKAAALADLLAGEQPATVDERYRLKPGTARDWKRNLKDRDQLPTLHPTENPTPHPTLRRPTVEAQQRQIGEIVLDLLRAKLEASRALAEIAQDAAWRARQPAAELAAFGQWLDSSALALGDRLAGAAPRDGDDPAGP